MNNTYEIIRIEDGIEVPLAAELPNRSLGLSTMTTVLIVVIVATLVFALIYLMRCYGYRSRIKELQRLNRKVNRYSNKLTWNVFGLRDLEEEIKLYLASSIQVE